LEHRYLSIKRRNQTFCLLRHSTDSIATVKHELARALHQHRRRPRNDNNDDDDDDDGSLMQAHEMRLILPTTQAILSDSQAMTEFPDEVTLHLVLAVSDTEFETVDVESMELQGR
jgi:hypothetical protein